MRASPSPGLGRGALVVHPGALGDVLLALPALAHLGRLAPDLRRVLAVSPRLAALLDGSPYAEETVDLDRLGLHRLFTMEGDPAVVDRLAAHDPIVSWLGAGDPAYRGHLAALGPRLGRRVVIARATPAPLSGRHASWHLLDTLAPLGPSPEALPPVRITAGAGERAWAAGWLEDRGLPPAGVLILHPGAGSAAKIWPDFAALARRLAGAGRPVVVVTGPADAAVAARLVAEAAVPEARIARDLSLRQLAALFERAAVVVGSDSGLSHLAAVVGCAVVALFGPTDPRTWAPLGPRVTVLAGAGPGAADPWRGLTPDRVERVVLEVAPGRAAVVTAGDGGIGR